MTLLETGPAPRSARILVLLAVASCLPPVIWWVTTTGWWTEPDLLAATCGPMLTVLAVMASPAFCREVQHFRTTCTIAICTIGGGSLAYAMFGVFFLLPAIPTLAIAFGVTHHPNSRKLLISGWTVAALVTAGWLWVAIWLRQPY